MPVGTSFWSILFDRFFQSVSSTLVEEFEGTIWTVSKEGRGPDPWMPPPPRCIPEGSLYWLEDSPLM